MAWLICGSVPQENFTLDEGPWNLDDGMLFPVGRNGDPLPVRRGTPALVASAILTCSALGEGTVEALLCGDTGNGKGTGSFMPACLPNCQTGKIRRGSPSIT